MLHPYGRLAALATILVAAACASTETPDITPDVDPNLPGVKGSDDPSRHFLIDGTPFTAGDWPRIELSRGEIRAGLGAVVWVCSDGRTVVDWRPGTTYAGNE